MEIEQINKLVLALNLEHLRLIDTMAIALRPVGAVGFQEAKLHNAAYDLAKFLAPAPPAVPVLASPFLEYLDSLQVIIPESTKRTTINLTPVEVHSGISRVDWAEMLLEQLPSDNESRNSWLLNYGRRASAKKLRASHHKPLIWTESYKAALPPL